MKKVEKDYAKKYGAISKDPLRRILDFLGEHRLTKKTEKFILDEVDRISKVRWRTIDFTIYLIPKATPRARLNSFTRTFYVSGAKDNHDIFKEALKDTDIPVISTPCKFHCTSYLEIPSNMSIGEKILCEAGYYRPTKIPDWDNLGKTYSDMVQETLIENDSLIIEGVSKKYYSLKPRIEVHIEYMEEFDSSTNKKNFGKKV